VGLFKELVLLPLAPVRGTAWVTEQIAEEAERQLYDEDSIKRELLQLEIDQEEGRMGEEERAEMERELLERLAVARERAQQAEQGSEIPEDYEVVEDG
jgi:hypothetical protein